MEKKNFACRMDAEIFKMLSDYSAMTRQSKTAIVELALKNYLTDTAQQVAQAMGVMTEENTK